MDFFKGCAKNQPVEDWSIDTITELVRKCYKKPARGIVKEFLYRR